jgi:hypothetical protein
MIGALFGGGAVAASTGKLDGPIPQQIRPPGHAASAGMTSAITERVIPKTVQKALSSLHNRREYEERRRSIQNELYQAAWRNKKHGPNKSWSIAFHHHLLYREHLEFVSRGMTLTERISALIAPYHDEPYTPSEYRREVVFGEDVDD